jgi:hypothetical protein
MARTGFTHSLLGFALRSAAYSSLLKLNGMPYAGAFPIRRG